MKEFGIINSDPIKAKLINECYKVVEGRVKLTTNSDTRMIIDLEVKTKEYADIVHLWKEQSRKVSEYKSNLEKEELKLKELESKRDIYLKELRTLAEQEGKETSEVQNVKA